MTKKKWNELKALSLDEKKALREETAKRFMDNFKVNNDYGITKEGMEVLDLITTLDKMISFKPDPNYYKKKRAWERAKENERAQEMYRFVAILKNF